MFHILMFSWIVFFITSKIPNRGKISLSSLRAQVYLYSKLAYTSRRERRVDGSNETTTKKRGFIKYYIPSTHKVLIYIEQHSYVPSSELGPPNPSPASECALPLGPKGGEGTGRGGHTRLRPGGGGVAKSPRGNKIFIPGHKISKKTKITN